ncbi:MAG: LysR family transcriptional regulator [Lachnospiraceae bacterium]|nr:LysR family transcriptional regulator [Lachnospiraceae bacterium]
MMLRQLQYFHTVVRTGSFTEAAEECFISQSAISQQIKALENDLGVKLLIRENRSFHLTEAGEYLYQKSGQLLEDFERIKNETIKIGCGSQNVLRLGYLKSYSGKELLNAVLEYNDIFPDTQVHIQNGNHEALYHLLNSNQLDLVLNDQRRAFSDKYVNFNLFQASFFLAIHEKHPMSSNPFFEPQMLNEIPIILIASKEQQEAEQDYYQNALGLGNTYIFAENHEEARLLVAGNRGVMIEEEFQGNHHNMDFEKKIPLMRYGTQMTKPYCLFWKVENDKEKIQRFAKILKSKFA